MNTVRRKAVHVTRMAFATLLGVVLASACQETTSPARTRPSGVAPGDTNAQVAFGVRYVLTAAGVKHAELRADSAMITESVDIVEFRAVRLTLLSDLGDTLGVAQAKAATYDMKAGRIVMRGGASIKTRDGSQLASSRVIYDAGARKISADTAFTLSGPAGNRSGTTFESNESLRPIRVRAPAPAARGTRPRKQ